MRLDLDTIFSNYLRLEFDQDKYRYTVVNRGKIIEQTSNISINDFTAFSVFDEICYRYLGMDEIILYDGTCSTFITKVYYNRIKKIWTSEKFHVSSTSIHTSIWDTLFEASCDPNY